MRRPLQSPKVRLPLALARKPNLPLGIRLLKLVDLPPGKLARHLYLVLIAWTTSKIYNYDWSSASVTNFLSSAVWGLHEGGEGEAQQGDGGLQEQILPSPPHSPTAGCSCSWRQAPPGKKQSSFALKASVHFSLPGIEQNCETEKTDFQNYFCQKYALKWVWCRKRWFRVGGLGFEKQQRLKEPNGFFPSSYSMVGLQSASQLLKDFVCLVSPPLLSDLLSLLLHWRGQASTFSSWPSLPSLPSAQHRNINSTTQPFAFSSGYSGNTHVPLQLEQCSADCTLTISCCTFVQRKCAPEDFFASTVHSWVTSSTESLHSLQLRRPWLPRCK